MRAVALAALLALAVAPAAARVPEEGVLERGEPRASGGCTSGACHPAMDAPTMHASGTFPLACADCHGGHPEVATDAPLDSVEYRRAERAAHVAPAHPESWPRRDGDVASSANPVRSYAALNQESWEFIRFFNPGDLRVADETCGRGGCHAAEVARVRSSMMTHGAMLWGAALYNNGAYPLKNPAFGESYVLAKGAARSLPARLQTIPAPTAEETRRHGVLPFLDPLPRFELSQPGNILRVFERGDDRLSLRGLGTINRTDPVFQGLQRTRLLDPLLSFLGTNDQPGDYRSSGCSACHVLYANDRDPWHSGPWARFGNRGTASPPPDGAPPDWRRRIAGEPGHPIRHQFTRAIPTSQCIVCHVHPGTVYANTYTGYIWWDNETDGEAMYPRVAQQPTPAEESAQLSRNPEAAALRGLWSDLYPDQASHRGDLAGRDFLERTWELDPTLTRTKFADFHGHGWLFRAVWKKDRKGNLLDARGDVVRDPTPETTQRALEQPGPGLPVHLKDIHLEKGMHCVDCHFEQDAHGDGRLYGETRDAIEVECVDCHGTVRGRATLRTSGPAAPSGGTDLAEKRTPFGTPLFHQEGDRLWQSSMVEPDKRWEVVQVLDSITPGDPHYNPLSHLAKTIRADARTWGSLPPGTPDVRAGGANPPEWGTRAALDPGPPASRLAHPDDDMACYTCHSSWMTSCFGCHLPMRANQRRPNLHAEGEPSRNWTQYDYQVLRDDVFMLGRDGTVKRNRVVPVRSSSAVLVGSQNQNREWLYSQQQTVSSEGFSGQAFNPHFPHTVRATETKTCVDCHLSRDGDNNAWMAQLLLQGTSFTNFLGRYVWVAEGEEGLEAIAVTEADEPQAVIGSHLHALAYPDRYAAHVARGRVGETSAMLEHPAADVLHLPWSRDSVEGVQLRGEYLYAANGRGGLRVYDVADVDNKANAERITTSVLSPLGQRLAVPTADAAAVVSPATVALDPQRARRAENEERPIHPLYAYLYVLDRREGLVVVPAGTLLDGDPLNNFLDRARLDDGSTAFNPDGALGGARAGAIAGDFLYVCADHALVVVDIERPTAPRVVATVPLDGPRAVAVQFRYAFVIDGGGLRVIDVTAPERARVVPGAAVPIADARDLYVARTYAYVAAGAEGLAIVDLERPEAPRIDQVWSAGGLIDDATAVKVGMTDASVFAYLADGRHGLRVIQLVSPDTPGYAGFSPRPRPDLPENGLVATYPTRGRAIGLSRGLDRDRAVDESGNQVAVFGRRGAGPLDLADQRRLYLRPDGTLYTVPAIRGPADVERLFPRRLSAGASAAR